VSARNSSFKRIFNVIFRAQLIPGHEVIGTVAKVGSNVTGFAEGDRCVADPGVTVNPNLQYIGRAQLDIFTVREMLLL
jgi:threonine dehydrogenase-like Zn-dependent dehydrogenase